MLQLIQVFPNDLLFFGLFVTLSVLLLGFMQRRRHHR